MRVIAFILWCAHAVLNGSAISCEQPGRRGSHDSHGYLARRLGGGSTTGLFGSCTALGGRLVRLTELVDLKGEAAAISDRKTAGDKAVLKRVQIHFMRDHGDDVACVGE